MHNVNEKKDNHLSLVKYLKSSSFPDNIVDAFQWYLIIDKVFNVNAFGFELSWWQVFIPFFCSLFVAALFYKHED